MAPFAPQLARLFDAPPEGEGWLHEAKWDGYRLLAVVKGGVARLWSRNAIEWTSKVPGIARALAALPVRSAAFDGELIAGSGTRDDFGVLQNALSGDVRVPLRYVLFDLLHLDGYELEGAALIERKALLGELLGRPRAQLMYSSHVVGHGAEAYAQASKGGLEGIISKRADAPYRVGRSDDWRKIKSLLSDEFAVVGYTEPRGSRTGLGSLLLARPEGKGWRYVGRVGTGFAHRTLDELAAQLATHERSEPTAFGAELDAELRRAHWLEPVLVAEVYYRGVGNRGLLRQPSMKALRPDKRAADLLDSDRAADRSPKRTRRRS